jgi:hypothetical protein
MPKRVTAVCGRMATAKSGACSIASVIILACKSCACVYVAMSECAFLCVHIGILTASNTEGKKI